MICRALIAAILLPVGAQAQDVPLAVLQQQIDLAAPGTRIEVPSGRYRGELIVRRSVHIVGVGRPLFVAGGSRSVVLVTAPDVTIEGIDIDGGKRGDLAADASGVLTAAPRTTIRDCTIRDTVFGVYLKDAPGSLVERCRIRGMKEKPAGEKGSGIHVWNTDGFSLIDNDIADVRDGLYIQASPHGTIRGNQARDLRYGLHYMNSDDNTFENNVFANGDAGTAIMYSRRLTFRNNRFVANRGFASVGLLLKSCDEVVAENNLIADNARGVFVEGSSAIRIRRNVIAQSDVALIVFASTSDTIVEGNSFVGNLSPLSLVGRRTDLIVRANYWSDHDSPDLDGDGVADAPYRLTNLFDHFRGNLTAADLFSRSLSASALATAERAFPVLEATPVVDASPLARPPALQVPETRDQNSRSTSPLALTAALLACVAGIRLLGTASTTGRTREHAA